MTEKSIQILNGSELLQLRAQIKHAGEFLAGRPAPLANGSNAVSQAKYDELTLVVAEMQELYDFNTKYRTDAVKQRAANMRKKANEMLNRAAELAAA